MPSFMHRNKKIKAMDANLLFWVYLLNAIFLINHEIDSAYWEEWKLFNPKDKNGITGFLIVHFPMLFVVMYGLVEVRVASPWAFVYSFFLSFCGVFGFFFHFYHIKKGRPEFNTLVSKIILIFMLLLSVIQAIITFKLM